MRESKAGRTVLHISGDVLQSSSFGWQWAVQREREREGERDRDSKAGRTILHISRDVLQSSSFGWQLGGAARDRETGTERE